MEVVFNVRFKNALLSIFQILVYLRRYALKMSELSCTLDTMG